jgi:hypothetical protein
MSVTPPGRSQQLQPPRWASLAGGVAGAILFGTFLIGAFGMLQSTRASSDNWLIILLKLNLRPSSIQANALSVVSALDVVLMLLFGILMAAMYPVLRSISRAWAAVAVVLPFLGIPIFLATGTAGRSGVLLAGLISSILALQSRYSGTGPASTGILASALLLFVGDFGTAAFPPSALLAVLIAIGYILWTVWLLLVTMELIRRSRRAAT